MVSLEAVTPGRGSVLTTIGGITTAVDRESHCTPPSSAHRPKALWWWSHGGRISTNRHGAENIHSVYELIDGGSGRRGPQCSRLAGRPSAATGRMQPVSVDGKEDDGTCRNSQSCHLILKLSHRGFILGIIIRFLLLIPVCRQRFDGSRLIFVLFCFFSLHSSVTQEEVKSAVLHLCRTVSLITLRLPDTAFKEISDATEATFIELCVHS